MSCPHSRIGDPSSCSQCIGAQPRVVTTDGSQLLVDGKPTGRTLDRAEEVRQHYARRGGRARARKPAP